MPKNINLWMDTWVLGKLRGLNKSHDKWTRGKPSASAHALVSFGPQELSAAVGRIHASPSGALVVFHLWSWCQWEMTPTGSCRRALCPQLLTVFGRWSLTGGSGALGHAWVVRFVTQPKSSPVCVLVHRAKLSSPRSSDHGPKWTLPPCQAFGDSKESGDQYTRWVSFCLILNVDACFCWVGCRIEESVAKERSPVRLFSQTHWLAIVSLEWRQKGREMLLSLRLLYAR